VEREKRFGGGTGSGIYGDSSVMTQMYTVFRDLFSKEEERRRKLEEGKEDSENLRKFKKEKGRGKKRFRRGTELIDEEDLEDDEYANLYEGEDDESIREPNSALLQLSRRDVEEAFLPAGFSVENFQAFIAEYRNLNVLSLSSNEEIITLLH
jgi:hypothetical protein